MKKPFQTILSGLVVGGLLLPIGTVFGQISALFIEDAPQSYVVRDGDTVNRIASQFLVDPGNWDNMWLPTRYIPDDNDLRAGDIVRIEIVNGRPRLSAQRGDRQVERMSPTMREIGNTTQIPAIPLEDIQSAFTTNRIVPAEVYDVSPYILAPSSKNVVIGTGDEVYARGDFPAGTRSFEIYRQVNSFRVRDNDDAVDIELENMGNASVIGSTSEGVVRLVVNGSNREIKVGDRLLVREENRFDPVIFPQAPATQVEGTIIEMTNTERMASQLDSVLIDLGSNDGLESGNVLAVLQPSESIADPTERKRKTFAQRFSSFAANEKIELPSREIGTILIYRVFEDLSYGVILSSDEPARLGDRVVSP